MTQLTEQFHIPEEYHEVCNRLDTLVQRHTCRLLDEEYWCDDHFVALQVAGGSRVMTHGLVR